MDDCFVLFRFPSSGNECHFITCREEELVLSMSYEDCGKCEGFVFAPFETSVNLPIVIFPKSKYQTFEIDEVRKLSLDVLYTQIECFAPSKTTAELRQVYHNGFLHFQSALHRDIIRKAVLSRAEYAEIKGHIDISSTFIAACRDNPDSFVAFVSSKVTGTWLLATPEVLVEKAQDGWHTIALAGTQPRNTCMGNLSGDIAELWDAKNIEEQKLVASYISDKLAPYTNELTAERPFTVQAGNLLHIRTDFYFEVIPSLSNPLGKIMADLHPTPAVCGFPADDALALVNEVEHCDRQYYSGFCGMIENEKVFRLYVTLRCTRIYSDYLVFYAGGGILPESEEEKEWAETEMKMQTIKNCIKFR